MLPRIAAQRPKNIKACARLGFGKEIVVGAGVKAVGCRRPIDQVGAAFHGDSGSPGTGRDDDGFVRGEPGGHPFEQ